MTAASGDRPQNGKMTETTTRAKRDRAATRTGAMRAEVRGLAETATAPRGASGEAVMPAVDRSIGGRVAPAMIAIPVRAARVNAVNDIPKNAEATRKLVTGMIVVLRWAGTVHRVGRLALMVRAAIVSTALPAENTNDLVFPLVAARSANSTAGSHSWNAR